LVLFGSLLDKGEPSPIGLDDELLLEAARSSATEMERAEDTSSPEPSSEIPGVAFLTSLSKATLFFDYFCHVAYRRFAHKAAQARVKEMITCHPRVYKTCVGLDLGLRLVLILLVTGAVSAVVIGTIIKTVFS
jgi:hypothetical protein